MNTISQWFEELIENVSSEQSKSSMLLVVLLVLVFAAGSLYLLLNSPS